MRHLHQENRSEYSPNYFNFEELSSKGLDQTTKRRTEKVCNPGSIGTVHRMVLFLFVRILGFDPIVTPENAKPCGFSRVLEHSQYYCLPNHSIHLVLSKHSLRPLGFQSYAFNQD